MSQEGNPNKDFRPVTPTERHFRIVGKEREDKIEELMRTQRLSRAQAELKLQAMEAVVDFNFIDTKNK